jgi:hypothetical protein
MFEALRKRGWRAVVGLIAAYALVLQAFLAYGIAAQAAAQGDQPVSQSLFVICTHDSGAAVLDGDGGVPAKPVGHCPLCTMAASVAATLPDLVSPPARHAVAAEPAPFAVPVAGLSFHRARAGLSRAPPQHA